MHVWVVEVDLEQLVIRQLVVMIPRLAFRLDEVGVGWVKLSKR